ncbi:DUF488 domain-containing protein [Legionella dresdenensis]|uniref:DUF488 domain-containing protein n=1 Tax=Legionella dresdenensis TaxID=450200 RepID=A0ABV8CGL7_9GAMM
MTHDIDDAIKICRIYTPPPRKQGVWILVDRLWPRGIKKESVALDLWLKEIAPSTALRKWFHGDPGVRWEEFVKKYLVELRDKGDLIEQIRDAALHSPVTLFYGAKDTQHNHARIVKAIVLSWPAEPDI